MYAGCFHYSKQSQAIHSKKKSDHRFFPLTPQGGDKQTEDLFFYPLAPQGGDKQAEDLFFFPLSPQGGDKQAEDLFFFPLAPQGEDKQAEDLLFFSLAPRAGRGWRGAPGEGALTKPLTPAPLPARGARGDASTTFFTTDNDLSPCKKKNDPRLTTPSVLEKRKMILALHH